MLIEKMFCWKKDYGIKKKNLIFYSEFIFSLQSERNCSKREINILFCIAKKKKRLKKHYFKIPFSYF